VLRAGLLGVLVVSSCASSFAAPIVDALIQTPRFNELTSYDAAQINNPDFSGFDANFLAPLNITNLLPQNGIVSIADSGSTAYGLIRTPGFNELTAYNRNQINNPDFFGFEPDFLGPLNITNLLPQNSIIAITVAGDDGSGGGVGGGGMAAPEPSTYALMIVGMFALEAARRLRRSRGKGSLATRAA
jgi:hypothetical protein